MNALGELKKIVNKQKTVTVTRLAPLVKKIEQENIKLGFKIRSKNKKLNDLNTKYQRALAAAKDRRTLLEENENLRLKHKQLQMKHSQLQEVHTELKQKYEGKG